MIKAQGFLIPPLKYSTFIKKALVLFFILGITACQNSPQKQNSTSHADSVYQKQSSPKETQDRYSVIPGKRMGNFVLDENAGAIIDSLPKPDYSDAAMGKVLLKWGNIAGDSLFMFNTQKMGEEDFKRIKILRSLSSKFRLDQDLGVNSAFSALKKPFELKKTGTFIENNQSYALYIDQKGIGFEIDQDSTCHGIVVFTEDYSPESAYIPFYSDFYPIQE